MKRTQVLGFAAQVPSTMTSTSQPEPVARAFGSAGAESLASWNSAKIYGTIASLKIPVQVKHQLISSATCCLPHVASREQELHHHLGPSLQPDRAQGYASVR